MLRRGEAVRRAFAEVVFDAADGHVHRRQFPCGAVFFLAVDGYGAAVALVGADEARGLHEEAAAAHCRVIDAAVVGLQHGDDEADDGFGGEVLAAAFAFGEGKAAEEVFVNVAEDVFGAERAVAAEAGVSEELDEADEGLAADAVVADALEYAFEAGVVFFDGSKASSMSLATPPCLPPQGSSAPGSRVATAAISSQRAWRGTQKATSLL